MSSIEQSRWIDQHRPTSFDQMGLLERNRRTLRNLLDRDLPDNVLLTGPTGHGKTTAARIFIDRLDANVLEMDGTDERGIDVIRKKVKTFVRGSGVVDNPHGNIVFLDEVHALTGPAQEALLPLMENYGDRSRFILATTEPDRILEPVKSRSTVVNLSHPPVEERARVLRNVLEAEDVEAEEGVVEALARQHEDFRALLRAAESWSVETDGVLPREAATGVNPLELRATGAKVLQAEDQLALLRDDLRTLGYAGPTEAAELVHLAFVSRCMERPINVGVRGTSSAGKTFTVEQVAKFHPQDSIHFLTGMSAKALAYTKRKTKHAYLVVSEAKAMSRSGVGRAILHGIAWGNRIEYDTVVNTPDGPVAKRIVQEGPTGLITTSTQGFSAEMSTRLLQVEIPDSPEQTQDVVEMLAAQASGRIRGEADLSPWRAASRWLEYAGTREIVVPFAEEIARDVPLDARMRRDFVQVLNVVKAHAFAHQLTRDTDHEGRIVAQREDYESAYRLLQPVFDVTVEEVPETWRETYNLVERLNDTLPEGARPGAGVTYAKLARELGLSRSGVKRRCEPMEEAGYLENQANKYQDARLVPGRSLPDQATVLPHPSRVAFAGAA